MPLIQTSLEEGDECECQEAKWCENMWSAPYFSSDDGQTLLDWQQHLQKSVESACEHLSARKHILDDVVIAKHFVDV